MEEHKRFRKVLQGISKKDIVSFKRRYKLLKQPIEKRKLDQIVRRALKQGFTDGIKTLVEKNGVECLRFHKKGNGFRLACKYGQIETVKFLLNLKDCENFLTAVKARKRDGLSIAIELQNEELTSVLVNSRLFNIDKLARVRRNTSRLFDALKDRNEKVAHFLIKHGADVTFVGFDSVLGSISCTCLSAIRIPSLLVEILKNGGNPNDVEEDTGESVLHLALLENADRKTISEIIRSGADIAQKDNYGKNALSCLRSIDQLYGFIDAGVQVKEMEERLMFSTLKFVLKKPHTLEDVRSFLQRGANANFYDDDNNCGDHILAGSLTSGFITEEDVLCLLEHGADPHQKGKYGSTALQLICEKGKGLMFKGALTLLDLGCEPTGCLLNVIKSKTSVENKTRLVKRLLERGANPNEECRKNISILCEAIKQRNTEITEHLVNHGADVNFVDRKIGSPIGNAVMYDYRDEEFGCLRALVNSPLKLIGCYLKDQLNNLAHGCTMSSTTRFFPAHAQHYFVFDVTGIFHLISAGADLLNGMSSKHTLIFFLQNGLYETSYRFLKCGLEIQYDADIIKNIENEFKEIHFENKIYLAEVSKVKKSNLVSLLSQMEKEPLSLQHLCRSKLRKELAVCGHSILPKIDELPISSVLKSYMKLDIQSPIMEKVPALLIKGSSDDAESWEEGAIEEEDDSNDSNDRFDHYNMCTDSEDSDDSDDQFDRYNMCTDSDEYYNESSSDEE